MFFYLFSDEKKKNVLGFLIHPREFLRVKYEGGGSTAKESIIEVAAFQGWKIETWRKGKSGTISELSL